MARPWRAHSGALLLILTSCARTGFQEPASLVDARTWVDAGPAEGLVQDLAARDALDGDAAALDAPAADQGAPDRSPGDQVSLDAPAADAQPEDAGAGDLGPRDGAGTADVAPGEDASAAPDATLLEDAATGPDVQAPDADSSDAADAATLPEAGRLAINAGAASSSTVHVALQLEEPGNALAALGSVPDALASWTITSNGGDGWVTEGSNPFGETAFTTSYAGCIRERTIDLLAAGFTRAELDAQPPIAVREWVIGVWPQYDDLYYVHVELRRNAGGGTLASYDHGTASAAMSATSSWDAIGTTFTGYGTSARYLFIEDGGRDIEYWAGYYGTRFGALAIHVGAVEVRLRSAGGAWSAWQPFAALQSFTLEPAQPGLHTVHAQFRDGAGSVLGETSDSIVVDCAPSCGANAHCVYASDPYQCVCDPGYSGDGYTCTPD